MAYDPNRLKQESIRSKNLLFHLPDENIISQARAYHLRNRSFFKPWNPRVRNGFYGLEFQTHKMLSENELFLDKRLLKFWLFAAEDKGLQEIIGHIAFSNIVWGGFRSCFLGYSIDQQYNGRGYATESVAKGLEVVFDTLRLHRIEANIMPRNLGSIRVAEKLGFECEGASPKYLRINGIWEDHLHYVVRNRALE